MFRVLCIDYGMRYTVCFTLFDNVSQRYQMKTAATMTRSEVRKTLKSHRGQMARLAKELDCSPFSVTVVLKGNIGKRIGVDLAERIMVAATTRAMELQRDLGAREGAA